LAVQEKIGLQNSIKDLEFVVIPQKEFSFREETNHGIGLIRDFLYMIKNNS
jgi:hypothetical protein